MRFKKSCNFRLVSVREMFTPEFDCEAELGKRGGHGARIGGGLLQHRHAAVGVVADDERDALIGKSGRGNHEAQQERPETKHARAFTAKRDDA